MLKKAAGLTRPTPARRDAPFLGQGCSERREEGVRFGMLSFWAKRERCWRTFSASCWTRNVS